MAKKPKKKKGSLPTKEITFTSDLSWLEPFIKSVRDLVPVNKIVKVKGYSVPIDKRVLILAQIHHVKGKYTITINTMENDTIKNTKNPKHLRMIIEDLAHEMAHMVHFEESSKHFKLMGRIITRFGGVLDKLGIHEDIDKPFTNFY